MLISKRDKIRKYLAGKDWQTFEQVLLGVDMSKTKTKQTLLGLRSAGEVEYDESNDTWRYISKEEREAIKAKSIEEEAQKLFEMHKPMSTPQSNQNNLDQDSIWQNSNIEEQSKTAQEQKIILPDTGEESHKKGFNAKLEDVERKLDLALGVRQKRERKAKLKRTNIRKIKKYNRKRSRAVILLGRNQNINLVKGEYLNGMIKINENFYDGSALYTWLWLGKQPVYIIPEWSIRPLCSEEVYARAKNDNTMIDAQAITIRAIKGIEVDTEQSTSRKKMNPMALIGIGIAAIVIVWLFWGGSKSTP